MSAGRSFMAARPHDEKQASESKLS